MSANLGQPPAARINVQTLWRNCQALRSDVQRLQPRAMLAFASSLPGFFRERVTVEEAEEKVKQALEGRAETFLALAHERIYQSGDSPYLWLLKLAGCEYSDLRASVHRHGLEPTLERLAREGVYLTSEEYKGKGDVVRGRQSIRISPQASRREGAPPGFSTLSSGTRNDPVRSFISLGYLAERTFLTAIAFSAHELFTRAHAMYDGILPAGGGMNNLLICARLGLRTDRWFARNMPVNTWLEGRYHYLLTRSIVQAGKRFGPGFPKPEFIDISDIHQIVHWVLEKNREGQACLITTAASNAARIARTAWEMGVSLQGTKFIVGGEPFTEAKREAIERIGARGIPRYAYGGALNIGYGCAEPRETDEVHVNEHLVALLPHPTRLAGPFPSIRPLLCSTLSPLASRLLLNVENGDYADLEHRQCRCHLGRLGLTLRLHHIRSFEKFASEGMNYFHTDLYELLERTLPTEFGGGPGDYQLVEEEDGNGQTRLTLRVHPEVGDLDDERLLARVEQALSEGSRDQRYMVGVWKSARAFRVDREAPHASPRGKILPLHLPR